MKLIALMFIVLWMALPVNAQVSPLFDVCDVFQSFSRGEDGLFDDAAYVFIDMPEDIAPLEDLWITDPRSGGESFYALYYSASAQELWIFAFVSLATWTDADGEHDGTHDFCYPVKVFRLRDAHER